MKYQYQIIDVRTGVILFDSQKEGMLGWNTVSACKRDAEYQSKDTDVWNSSYVKVLPVSE